MPENSITKYQENMRKVIDQLTMTINVFNEGIINLSEAKRKTEEAIIWLMEELE